MISLLFCITLIQVFNAASSFEFEDPHQPGVTFGEVEGGVQQVYVDEDNWHRRIAAVLVTGIQGTVSAVVYNGAELLDLSFKENDTGNYFIEINSLDYESLSVSSFLIDIFDDYDAAKDIKSLNVWINNLDDENPIFTPGTCLMKENTTITVDNTECVFTIMDPDGFLNQTDFSDLTDALTKKRSDLFLLTFKEFPNDNVYESDVYLILQDGQVLDYEKIMYYNLDARVKDGANHPTIPSESVKLIVDVEDIPDTPPIWRSFMPTLRIEEETEATFKIEAEDGDFGINNPINYDLGDNPSEAIKKFVSIDQENGIITIHPIDRDGEGGLDRIDFEVRAYEVGDKESQLIDIITIFIDDIDDNSPLLSVQDSNERALNFSIEENYSDQLDYTIIVNDIDLGDNAMYTLAIESLNGIDYTTTFQIIPSSGYEETQLALAIISAKKLDYEDDDWKVIEFEVVSTGTKNASHTDRLPVTISLIDLIDEFPQFDQAEYTVSVYENVTIDTVIAYIKATDRDAIDADGVNHFLIGKYANSILSIEELGGDIKTTQNNSFDYEKQTEVQIQVQAVDHGNNTNTTQLTINVIDLNDEPPRLVVSSAIQVDENREEGFVLETSITASDDDQTANLTFWIDWDQSYGTKNSRPLVKPEEIEQIRCIEVATIEEGSNQQVRAELSIKEIVPGNSPDYEVFDTLFIKLVVTDQNTQINRDSDSATVVINIGNLNDNYPEFVDGTDSTKRYVTERTDDGTLVSQITANDVDNLQQLEYSIQSADSPNWIRIDNLTGSLYVNLEDGEQIICDYPNPLWYINYTVTVFDGDFKSFADISIYINDVNNQKPRLSSDIFSINEDNGTTPDVSQNNGATIYIMKPQDDDRDEAFKTVVCSFDSYTNINITSRFKIEDNKIKVDLPEGTQLDREEFPDGFNFRVTCRDNPNHIGGDSNTMEEPASFTIILNDLNDKYPVITTDNIKLSEKTEKGNTTNIEVEDEDLGENGEVSYFNITKIQRFETAEHVEEMEGSYENLFSIEVNEDKKSGTLTVLDSLRGKYGYFVLTIETKDAGAPPLSMDNKLNIIVSKYNFEQPKFNFPEDRKTYYLRPEQDKYSELTLYNQDLFEKINATDNQGNKYNIIFSVVRDESKVFHIENLANSLGQLELKTLDFDASGTKTYEIGIMAQLDTEDIREVDEAPFNVNCTITIGFFDKNTDPVFDYHSITYDIPENDDTITKPLVGKAKYPDVDIPGLDIYYLLNPSSDIFEVDMNTGELSLKSPLDYENVTEYSITIQASKSKSINTDASPETKLVITINVIDVNDNPPVFEQDKYFAPILSGSDSQSDVIQVIATDVDTTSEGKLYYTIDDVTTTLENLNNNKSELFAINKYGLIKVQFVVTDAMKDSYFILEVTCHDEDDLQGHATVTIYTVTSENTVNFKFENELSVIKDRKKDITNILDVSFGYTSNMENPKVDSTGSDSKGPVTIAPIYFVNVKDPVDTVNETKKIRQSTGPTVEAVKGVEILRMVTDVTVFNQLKTNFSNNGFSLQNFVSQDDTNENLEEILKMWLIGVSVVLGALCLCLLIAFILKTRALKQRIKNLSSTRFGSQESGLNRQGVTAPTTNRHAIEGSNPVYNANETVEEVQDFDRRSVTSGDSDMIGVEDDDAFGYGENERHNKTFDGE